MQPTRKRILSYLEVHPPASADEVGRYLEMTPANIRYHLDILEREGLIQSSGTRSTGGAGRPIQLYSLTSFSLGENLTPLLEGMLSVLKESDSRDQTLVDITETLLEGKATKRKYRIQRFNQGVELLNSMHYHASWEAHQQGPRVELRNCPYRDLADRHPILCQMDQLLLERMFGTEFRVIQLKTQEKRPIYPCIFQAD
jgi:predicted ArsR family transcriptional regulator